METYQVYFQYYSDGENGQDRYHFSDREAALCKMEELKQAIAMNFAHTASRDVLDEDDLYGIMDHNTGNFAKVIFEKQSRQ